MTPVWKQRFGCGYAAPGTRWRAACQSRDSSLSKRMGGIPHPQAWPSLPLPHLEPLPPATRTHLPSPFPVFHTRHAEQSAERPRLVTVVRPCGHSTLRKVTLLLNRRSVVSYEQLLLDVSEALGFPRWHRARVTRLYTPHAREVRGVCDFFRGEAAFLALGKSRPELQSVEEALEELFPQHTCYRNDALRAWERRLQPSPDKAAKADSGYSEGTDIHTHPDKDTHTSLDTNTQTYSVTYTQGCNLDTHTHTHQDTLTQPNTHRITLTHHNTYPKRHSTHKNKHPTRQPIHPIHTHLDTDAHTHRHPNTHSNQHTTHPSHPPNHLQRVKVKVAAKEILSSPIGPPTQEEELGEELDTPPTPLCRNCKPSEGPNPRAGRAPLPPVTRKQTGNGPNDQEVEKPHVGPTPLHTGPICRLDEESLSQSEPSSSESKQEEARTKQEVIFDLPSDGSDVTLSDIERCYDIGRMVGDGNFAVVHECHRRDNGEAFAVKIVEHSKLIGREHMMQNELSLLGSLSHPRVVRLFTHHHTHTHSYLVMEMVAGGDLFEAIAVCGKFPEEEAGLMVCDVSEALRYIHSKTIVHRDLKPENLLVECSSDGVSRLKLGDFGLAMVVTEPIFTVCGTPTYVAPEILSETGYGLPVDLWALGVILYVLLCGFPPFRSRDRDQGELFQMIREAHLTFLSPYWDDISDGARGLVRALLQVDPTERLTAAQTLMHPWIQTTTDQYRPTQTTTDQYRPTQISTDQYRPTQISTDQYRPTQTTTDQYRPTQTTTDQYRPTQTTTDQYRPTQISTDQQSPAQPSKGQHRHEPISANQQSPAKTSTEHYRPVQSPTTDQSRPAQTATEHHRPVPTPDQQRPPHPIPPAHHPPTQPASSPHSSTQPDPSPHSSTQPDPSPHSTTQPAPSPHSSTQPAPSPHSSTQPAPSPHSTTQPAPSLHSTTQPAPSPHSTTQPAPSPHSTTQPAPSPHSSTQPAPSPHSTTQPAPSPHSSTQPAPSPHSTTQPAPSLHSTPQQDPSTAPQPPGSSTSQPPHPISPPSILSTATSKPSCHPPGRTLNLPSHSTQPPPLHPPTLPPSLPTPTHSQPNTHPVPVPARSVPPLNPSS
ncbi:serine/threonine-protein kinase DCLK3 [Oncorhynchus kisutch]|uniref:non-specific serine/threonine protein kinase n=1 Tax=Oncorhynchus kisutch TaxID=8019 RepID=A0A8C7G1I2_ONCKI|nr:serine/threonine-protein kinase DCLK3 [Oncorhynchus kisutch]